MPSIGRVAGFVVYIYWPDHATPHIHLRKPGREVSVAIGGQVFAGTLSGAEQREVAAWIASRYEKIVEAINDLKEGRLPQWVD